jgi:adhesin transport system outer membrane protein
VATKQGALIIAQNKFRSVFGNIKLNLKKLKKPAQPYRYMTRTLAESIQIAKKNSATLLKAKITKDKAIQTIKGKKATLWGPTTELKVEYKDKSNWGGTAGREEETLSVIEVKFPLFAGGKNTADYRGAQHDRAAAHSKYLDSLRTVEEKVRNAWQKVSTSKATAGFKRNQANIDSEFLRLARKERKLGKRSLQDILSAENDYISSLGAAVKAEKDMQLAAYELFENMGVLDVSIILGTKTTRITTEKKTEVRSETASAEKENSTFKDGEHNWNKL